MTPFVPLGDPLPQPAPPLVMEALLLLTFLLHLLAMNVVLGGSLLALHWRFSRRAQDAGPRGRLLQLFEKTLPVALAATVTLGVAPLLFVQVLHGRLFFTSSVLMGWLWLGLVPLVILAYYAAYALAFGKGGRRTRRALALAVPLLVCAVAFLQVTNATRTLRPDTFAAAYRAEPRGLSANLADPTFWPRTLHVLLGAVAVAALALALVGVARRRSDPELARFALRRGGNLFALATAANIFVGLLLLVTQPTSTLISLAGADNISLALLVAGILLAVTVAGTGLLALGARDPGSAARLTAVLLLPTLATMLLLREDLRRLAGRAAGLEPPPLVVTQWGPLGIFLACLLAATLTIAWMTRALARGRAPGTE